MARWESLSGERTVSMLWFNWQVLREAAYPWHSVKKGRTVKLYCTPQPFAYVLVKQKSIDCYFGSSSCGTKGERKQNG